MSNALTPSGPSIGGLAPRGPGALRPAPARTTPKSGRATDAVRQHASQSTGRPSRKRLPTKELVLITTQLCILIRSGLDLAEAIKSISRRVQHAGARDALERLCLDIESGLSFSDALGVQQDIFGATFAATVSAGEASGNLPEVLNRLKDLLRNELKLQSTVKSILVYPAVLVAVGSLVLTAMVFFVLPQFTKVYRTMDRPPPPLTQLLLDVGSIARGWWWALIPAAGLAVYGLYRCTQTEAVRRWRDQQLLTFRITARVIQNLVTGRVFVLIGTMLHSGVPLLDAMRLAAGTVNNVVFRDLFAEVESEVLAGRHMSPVMADSKCVPEGTSDLISTAETSGDLGGVLQTVGDFYQDEGEQQLRNLVKVLEPAIIIVMGVVVAGIVLAIMLPLIKLATLGGRS